MATVAALIPAAGVSKRFSSNTNKLNIIVGGKSVLKHTIAAFDNHKDVGEIVIVVSKDMVDYVVDVLSDTLKTPFKVVAGGSERQDSVRLGLEAVSLPYVLIHDAARPLVSEKIIDDCVSLLVENDAVVTCVPCVDTIKVCENGYASKTLDRSVLYSTQTPQAFKTDLIKKLHKKALEENFVVTDDASICEWAGIKVKIANGDYSNIKVTTKSDIDILKSKLGDTMKCGIGYDVHKLVEGRKLILGGVNIDFPKGLLGHSDADVLVHAIMDALLGAACLGDIGKHFPPSDDAFKNSDSLELLKKVKELLDLNNYTISNIDSVIVAQKPKLAPYIDKMRENIASVLELDINLVSIKATTTEHLGFEGREEGISSQAIVTII